MSLNRLFTPYELTQLHRFSLGDLSLPSSDHTPVEYLTHHAEFYHRDFYVNEHVLIPRLDSEKIIDLALEYAKTHYSSKNTLTIADVCTGSGCLGITLFLELQKLGYSHLTLTLSDISPQSLKVAQFNIQKYLPQENVTLLESNLFHQYPSHFQYNLILSNPPYIPSSRIKSLDSSVKDHEPLLALDGGPRGDTLINQFLNTLPPHTAPHSLTLIEIDHTHQMSHFKLPSSYQAEIILDDHHQPRFLTLVYEC